MGLMQTIKAFLFGIDLVSTEELTHIVDTAIKQCDKDGNGYINIDEFLSFVRDMTKKVM